MDSPFLRFMGIAWFDESCPPPEGPCLRTGGLPLMAKGTPWPTCPRCELPMLFRAQVPLACTYLVSFDDPRLLLVFECHAPPGPGELPCTMGTILWSEGDDLEARPPPATDVFDVTLQSTGCNPESVTRLVYQLADTLHPSPFSLPFRFLCTAPSSIAKQAARAITDIGGTVDIKPSPPTLLTGAARGGRLVPFDDGIEGNHRTTLPPLEILNESLSAPSMRGLLGGNPGERDAHSTCHCGRGTRIALRLLAMPIENPTGIALGPSVVHVCTPCRRAQLVRSHGHVASRDHQTN